MGGVLEIVVDGETGLLVTMKDVHAMAEAICKILSDPVKAEKMGAAGKERFLEKFTIEKTVEKVQSIYSELVATGYEIRHFSPQSLKDTKGEGFVNDPQITQMTQIKC